jgi:two-component system, chemotaxis family, sensor histidine kinase and response regulator PixL
MLSSPEIRDQAYQFFIQESVEFLQALEEGLLKLREDHSVPQIHVLMRAAHSIKGGAASIGGMDSIQAIAHQLEDVLRALYQDDVVVDMELEGLLLEGYDCLRNPLMQQIETGTNDGDPWVEKFQPVYEKLVERLGEAMEANNELPTAAELGVDIVQVIFMGDIEEGLVRIANVLENPSHPEVAGELRAQAQVFLGVGELVNFSGFVAIAKATQDALELYPHEAKTIGQLAYENFKASQIAVLGGARGTGGSPSEALLAWTKPGVSSSPTITLQPTAQTAAIDNSALMGFFSDDEDEDSFIGDFVIANAAESQIELPEEPSLELSLFDSFDAIEEPIAAEPLTVETIAIDTTPVNTNALFDLFAEEPEAAIGDSGFDLEALNNSGLSPDDSLVVDDGFAVDDSLVIDDSFAVDDNFVVNDGFSSSLDLFSDDLDDVSRFEPEVEENDISSDSIIPTFSPPAPEPTANFEESIAFTDDDFSVFNDLEDQFGSEERSAITAAAIAEPDLSSLAATSDLGWSFGEEEVEPEAVTALSIEGDNDHSDNPLIEHDSTETTGWDIFSTITPVSADDLEPGSESVTSDEAESPARFFTWDSLSTSEPPAEEIPIARENDSLIEEEDTTIQNRIASIIDEEETTVQPIETPAPNAIASAFETPLIFEEDTAFQIETALQTDINPEPIEAPTAEVPIEVVQPLATPAELIPTVEAAIVIAETPVVSKAKSKRAAAIANSSNTPAFSNTIRVDLGRLDRLNNLIGELVTQENSALMQSQQIQSVLGSALLRFGRFEKVTKQLQGVMDSSQTDRARIKGSQQAKGASQDWDNPVLMPGADFDPLQMDAYNDFDLLIQEAVDEIAQLSEAMRDITLLAQQSQKIQRHKQQTLKQVRNDLLWARMIPIGDVLQRFPRMIRDLSSKYNKPTTIKLSGTNTLVDKAMLEKLFDPLVHLVRNGFDHGIEPTVDRLAQNKPEQATIEIRAYHRSSQIYIEVSDDGRGINLEKIRMKAIQKRLVTEEEAKLLNEEQIYDLMFSPGFSTADKVSELSGRGVGLDAVRTQVRSLKGNISITSETGKGTTFTLRLPLTLTITKLLVFSVQSRLMAVAVDSLVAIVAAPIGDIQTLKGGQFYHWQEQFVPIYPQSIFHQNYQLPQTIAEHPKALTLPTNGKIPLLLIAGDSQTIAIQADQILYEQELAIKPFGRGIAPPDYLYGCTLLGDGTLLPVIDARTLVEFKKSSVTNRTPAAKPVAPVAKPQSAKPGLPAVAPAKTGETTILVIDDSLTSRQTLSSVLKKSGYRVLQARDGREGLEQLQQDPNIHLVFCDIEMPRMNGFEFLTHCRPNYPKEKLPIVMLTSRSNEKHRQIAKYMGATTYLTKPFMEHELVKTLESCLTERFQMFRRGGELEEALAGAAAD